MSTIKSEDNLDKLLQLLQIYTDKLKNNTISNSELILLTELSIKTDIVNNHNNINKESSDIDEKNMLKYTFLGYWLYNQISL